MLFSLQQEHRVSSHGLRRNPTVHLGTAYKITQTCYFLMAITQHHINQANSPWTVQTILGIYSLGPNLLEPKSRPSRPQQILIHYITLKQKVKQVGEKPLPFRSLSNSTKRVPTCSPCRGEQLCSLPRRSSPVRSSGNLERRWSLSL